jgi:hypothetical protein
VKPVRKPVRKIVKKTAPIAKLSSFDRARAEVPAKTGAVPVEMEELETTPVRGKENAVRLNGGHKQMPLDCPAYLTVTRLMSDDGLEGHVITLDAFSFGRTIHVRLGREKARKKGTADTIKVWVGKKKIYEGTVDDSDNQYKGERQ